MGGAGGSMASTAGASGMGISASRGASALRAATSRVGSRTPSRSSSGSGSQASSGSMGSEGMGSTSGSLFGGGGPGGGGGGGGSPGGGGGGDFALVLQTTVKPGSMVKKGDMVAEFDRQSMLNRLDDYRSSVAQTEASFKKTKAELDVSRKAHDQTILTARGDLEKARLDLKTIPVVSAIDAERLKLALEESEARHKQLLTEVRFVETSQKAQLRDSELELQQSRVELRRSEANAERMVVRAPIDGLTVMQSMIRGSEFDQIKEGDQLYPGMPFMQIVDPSSMVINATLNQVDVEKLRLGQKARVRFDAFPGLELPAVIHSIGTVTRASRYRPDYVKELPVSLKLTKMDPRVIPDLSVSADVILESEQNTAVVPLAAVFAGEGGSSTPAVYVRQPTGWQRRPVVLGAASNTEIAVRSGLRAGEEVALERPPQALP